MDENAAEIAEITFFLAKEKHTFDSVFDAEKNISSVRAYQTHDFTVSDAPCRFVYFESNYSRTNPPWLDFVNDQLPDDHKVSFQTLGKSPNGTLLIKVKDRIFVAMFGRSSTSYLDRRVFEPDFGIKTAMNMCGNEEVRQTKSSSNTITPTQIDRQVSRPSDTFTFGLSEAEDLKYISAHMKGRANVTGQVRSLLDKRDWGAVMFERTAGAVRSA